MENNSTSSFTVSAIPMKRADKPMGWMTTRDYFAAHAPEMPDWFVCDNIANFKTKPTLSGFSPEQLQAIFSTQAQASAWHKDPFSKDISTSIMDSRLLQYQQDYREWWDYDRKRPVLNAMNKLRAWRYYYADMMLAEEPENQPKNA